MLIKEDLKGARGKAVFVDRKAKSVGDVGRKRYFAVNEFCVVAKISGYAFQLLNIRLTRAEQSIYRRFGIIKLYRLAAFHEINLHFFRNVDYIF